MRTRWIPLLLLFCVSFSGCGKDPDRILEEADAAREVGLHQAALDRYLELLESDPPRFQFLEERIGDVYSAMNRPEQAQAFWSLALKHEPENAKLWFKRGAFLVAGQKAEEGLEALERAVALDPDLMEAHLNLGVLHYQAQRMQPALLHLRKAASLAPQNANVQKALGAALLQDGDRAGAAAALYAGWKIDRKTIEADKLFQLLGSNGQWKMAVEVGEVAASASGDPLLLIQYGASLIRSGQVEKGRHILRSLAGLDLPPEVQTEVQKLLRPGGSTEVPALAATGAASP
jgi:tetratricopeptide (TPR) repeat protein